MTLLWKCQIDDMKWRTFLWLCTALLLSFVLTVYFLFFHCTNVEGIKISGLLRAGSLREGHQYCKMLKRSLKSDKSSLKEFSTLGIYDAASYDHGAILVKVICRIGADNYLQAIDGVSDEEINAIEAFLRAGIEYGSVEDSLCVNSLIQEVLSELDKKK